MKKPPLQQSFIEMPSDILIPKCLETQRLIQALWDQEVERRIAPLMVPPLVKPSFFQRLFRITPEQTLPQTRDQAIATLKVIPQVADWMFHENSPWENIHLKYSGQYDHAQSLINLARLAPTVSVTAADLDRL